MKKNTGRTVAIAQARLGSSRLPLKSLLTLGDRPIIDWVVHRLAKAKSLDAVIVAVPDTPLDRVLLGHLRSMGVECLAGPENDVLERYRLAARHARADHIVRVCADNPLVDPDAIDELVEFYRHGKPDYAYNHIPRGNLWPDGLGAEIIAADLLERMAESATQPSQREHCMNYIWDNADSFSIATFDPAQKWLQRPDIKLDIDTAEDFGRLALLPINPDSSAREIIEAWDAARG